MKLSINEIRQLQKGLRMTICNIKDDELYKKLHTELGLMLAENQIEKLNEINKALRDGFKVLRKKVDEQIPHYPEGGKETRGAEPIMTDKKKGTLKFLIDNCDSIVSAKVGATDLGFDEFEIKINLSDSTKNERDLLFSFRETNKNTNLIFL